MIPSILCLPKASYHMLRIHARLCARGLDQGNLRRRQPTRRIALWYCVPNRELKSFRSTDISFNVFLVPDVKAFDDYTQDVSIRK